jgi:hypothetical protein
MYLWYKLAISCYAYLSDVDISHPNFLSSKEFTSAFKSSRWFTRGWTLQELLAPKDVVFFSRKWQPLGSKDVLCSLIQEATGIPQLALLGAELDRFCIAERMSWASKRVTTRAEDRDYSLLGLFGVNMPMLYGEGHRAFIRLQEEIMQKSDDQSLFAWADEALSRAPSTGILAASPKAFANSKRMHTMGVRSFIEAHLRYRLLILYLL